MKPFLLFLSALFIATTAIAEQITINWGADNEHYTATSCEIGNDVILPTTPTKRGHIFKGWIAEHFYRGTWPDWTAVPSNADYSLDIHNNQIPKKNDYIIVSDASLYPVNAIIVEQQSSPTAYAIPIKCTVDGVETETIYSRETVAYICDGKIKVSCFSSNTPEYYANTDLYYKGELLHQGDVITEIHFRSTKTFYVSLTKIDDAWKFVYQGTWETDGKYGWKPETQIVE